LAEVAEGACGGCLLAEGASCDAVKREAINLHGDVVCLAYAEKGVTEWCLLNGSRAACIDAAV
jgi:hypothetical protein